MCEERHDSRAKPDQESTRLRADILARFEAWLDVTLAEEEPPAGVAAEILAELTEDAHAVSERENGVDLYALWSTLTTLSQETKLQGRSFQRLHDTLAPWTQRLGTHEEALSASQRLAEEMAAEWKEREAQAVREAERRTRQEQVELLLDMRDRLARGLEAARAHLAAVRELPAPSRLASLLGRRPAVADGLLEATTALEKGCSLSLDRLDDALDRHGIHEIECEGQPFDPHRMAAVDILETSQQPEGTVLEVHRRGYEWNGEVCRPAEVKVARAPGRSPEENHDEP